MKYFLSLLAICLATTLTIGQVAKKDTTEIEKPLVAIDTIVKMPIELQEVYISNKRDFKSEEDQKRFYILQRRVLKVYPYAKTAADRL
ncbi:DUF4294 domain-containing protein, partial [Flavobacterium psychrophilum]